jgi:DNA polymerase-3 subunit delta'
MSIVPLYGHDALRQRLLEKVRAGTLPQSLLLHGPPGVGKQRLALWLGQLLLCRTGAPCGSCQHCRYALALVHPDLTWIFPRPRPRDSDRDADDVKEDLAEATSARAASHGLYAPPPGSDGIFVATIRFLVRQAALTPALAARKVFVIGDADRMVLQEGSEFAANAVLKLLEEPPNDTWVIVTTSAVGALLPTIRSRVVAVRVPRLTEAAMHAFLTDPAVSATLDKAGLPASADQRVALADGAPGRLLAAGVRQSVLDEARRFLETATSIRRDELLRLAFVQGQRGSRGAYSDLLDALTVSLHDRLRRGAQGGDTRAAYAAARAIDVVEDAKLLADGNVNPQLITAKLLRQLAETLG